MGQHDPVDALAREGFGSGAEPYDRGRPGYPAPAVAWLCVGLDIAAGSDVLDLGTGTGKLGLEIRRLSGADVVGVEPVSEMRAVASAHGLPVLDGTAERIPVPDAAFDAVVCGEAFHWFDGPSTLDEIARVLRPDGGLGLVWNVHAWDRDAGWVRAIEELLEPHSDGRPETRYGSFEWLRAFANDPRWSRLERRSYGHELRLDADGLVDHVHSVAFIAALPGDERATLLREVARIARGLPETIVIPYRTDAYVTRCRPAGATRGSRHPRQRAADPRR
jgi:SAM-dependent methyltransferase